MIYTSFNNWEQHPISTTIETQSISQITFPNVTVCPPKNLFLNLNYDISKVETVRIDKEKRKTLIEASLDILQETFYLDIMRNMTKVEDPDKYYNWYHGYTKIEYPYQYSGKLYFSISTFATKRQHNNQNF